MAIMNRMLSDPEIKIDYELWILIDHVHSAISRARELEMAQLGVTLEQAGVLHTLTNLGGSATNADIADTMVRQYPSTTTLITRMEKLGLVKKEKSGSSKKFEVSITSKGKNIYYQFSYNSLQMVFEDLSPEEKQKLITSLTQLVEKGRNLTGIGQKLPFLSKLEK
jgi:DNA-binding MarR family transcriptional regulator